MADLTVRCPECDQPFGPRGLPIHIGRKHSPECRWVGENRGWCVTHDNPWPIDRAHCVPMETS